MNQEQKVITFSIKKFLKWIIALVVIVVVALFILRSLGNSRMRGMAVGDSISSDIATVQFDEGSTSKLANPMSGAFGSGMFGGRDNGSIADTRQFMKVNYSGTIQTRDIKGIARDVRGIIRDTEGRIDDEMVAEKYARVSFVIPKSNLDDFRDEIESLTHKKLYVETTSSQNLLNQKQSIEERADLTNKSLSDLQSEKSKAEAEYKKEIASLQAQLKEITLTAQTTKSQLDANQNAVGGTPEYAEKKMLINNYDSYMNQINSLKNYIAEKNTKYTQNKNRLDSAIAQSNNQLGEIKKDDKAFAENIETVTGSVSMQWVSVWQLMKIFSPIHPIFIIIILVLLLWYILKKMKIVPLIVIKW